MKRQGNKNINDFTYTKEDEERDLKRNKVSVALQYNPGEQAPKIIASGRGAIAEKIIEKAKEADVPLYEDSKLANTLSKLEIGDMIPPELYNVVAEILVFVDDCDRIKAKLGH
jgi:flagellar biosynthesis protein